MLDNGLIRVGVDGDGLLASVRDLPADRELLAPSAVGNLLQLHRDTPIRWDAWDIDAHYRRSWSTHSPQAQGCPPTQPAAGLVQLCAQGESIRTR